jgi:hypothetical protein
MNYNFHLKKIGQIKNILLQRFVDDIPKFKFKDETSFNSPNNITIYDYKTKEDINIQLLIRELSTILNPNDYYSASIDCMSPDSFIKEHVDQNVKGENQALIFDFHKIHIPLVTNMYAKQIWIKYSEQFLNPSIEHLELGGVFAYDNTIPHCAINLGDTARYHLVLRYKNLQEYDWMKNG